MIRCSRCRTALPQDSKHRCCEACRQWRRRRTEARKLEGQDFALDIEVQEPETFVRPRAPVTAAGRLDRAQVLVECGFVKEARALIDEPKLDPGRLVPILFIPDTHAPYHDEAAFSLMLRAAAVLKPEIIVILGDFADFYAVSSHSKNPERAADLQYEVGIVKEKLAQLDKLGARRKIYVAGNHEDRLERYLMDRAPALFKTVKIPEVLELAESGWEYVPYKRYLQLGKLRITHDTGKAGQNAHRQAMGSFRHSTIIGHTHRMELSVLGSAEGVAAIGAMFGWLGDFDSVDYMHQIEARANWVHGFGLGWMEPNGVIHLQPVPIVKGAVVVAGQLVR